MKNPNKKCLESDCLLIVAEELILFQLLFVIVLIVAFTFFFILFAETELSKFLSSKGEKKGPGWLEKCRSLVMKSLSSIPDLAKGTGESCLLLLLSASFNTLLFKTLFTLMYSILVLGQFVTHILAWSLDNQ